MAGPLFRWEHLPDRLLRRLAETVDLPRGEAAAALAERYGVPPGEEFVADSWPVLLEVWLRSDRASAAVITARLREQGVGDRELAGTSAPALLLFLRSCEPSPPLPGIVLSAFLAVGAAPTAAGARNPRRRSRRKVAQDFRSHVEGLVRERLGVDELDREPDGALRLAPGRVLHTVDDPAQVRLVTRLLDGAAATPDLLATLNDLNRRLRHARIFLTEEGSVTLALDLRGPDLQPDDLAFAIDLHDHLAATLDKDLQQGAGNRTAKRTSTGDPAHV